MNRVKVRSRTGFTIIEVMVAVLILATALVAIFGAQFGAMAQTVYARNLTAATGLGRCKMSELELTFMEEGFQEGDQADSGSCCEFVDGEQEVNFSCEWEVKTVTFPDMSAMMAGESDGSGDAGGFGGLVSGIGGMLGEATEAGDGLSGLSGSGLDPDAMADASMGMIGELLPQLTPLLEQAIRRVTVTVRWKEGQIDKHFELIQYVTHPTAGPLKILQEQANIERGIEELQENGLLPAPGQQGRSALPGISNPFSKGTGP